MTSPTASLRSSERGSALTAAISVLAALGIIAAVVAAFYIFDTPPPASHGKVLSLEVFPISNTTGGGVISGGVSGQPESFNEVIVLANVELKNTSKAPLDLFDLDSYLDIPNTDTYEDGAASHQDFERVFLAYPQLKSKEAAPLRRDITLQPGQDVIGQLVFHYPITLDQWKARKSLHIVVDWKHQNNLVLKLKGKATSTSWQH